MEYVATYRDISTSINRQIQKYRYEYRFTYRYTHISHKVPLCVPENHKGKGEMTRRSVLPLHTSGDRTCPQPAGAVAWDPSCGNTQTTS